MPSILTDRTYYVAQTGDNNNNGLTALTPFATINHAFEVIGGFFVPDGVTVTVQLLAGLIEVGETCIPPRINGNLVVTGNPSVLTDVDVSLDGTSVLFQVDNGQRLYVDGINVSSVSAGGVVLSITDGNVSFGNILFGANLANIITMRKLGIVSFVGSVGFNANFTRFLSLVGQGMFDAQGRVFALTGTLTMTDFALISAGYARFDGSSFTGTNPTGRKYVVNQSGILFISGATLPGVTAGTTATQGQAI